MSETDVLPGGVGEDPQPTTASSGELPTLQPPIEITAPTRHAQPGPALHAEGKASESRRFKCRPAPDEDRQGVGTTRVSTSKQMEESRASIPEQKRDIKAIAAQLHIELPYLFEHAVSGAAEVTERLEELYRLARARKITDVLFAWVDRAFRKSSLAHKFFATMKALGVHVWIGDVCVVHADARVKLGIDIELVFAEFEREILIERGAKRREYAMQGTTYKARPPFGFQFEVLKAFRRLMPDPALTHDIVEFFQAVAAMGPTMVLYDPVSTTMRNLGLRLDCRSDVRAFVGNAVYKGLNPYGKEAFQTPFTDRNRIVSDDLWASANRTCNKGERNTSELDDIVATIGLEGTVDQIRDVVLTLCRRCLAPINGGRVTFHRGIRRPSWECCGVPLDLPQLQRIAQEKGIVSDGDVRKLVSDAAAQRRANKISGKVHEVNIVPADHIDAALSTVYHCDKCQLRDIRQFDAKLLRHGVLACKRCGFTKPIPDKPWTRPAWHPLPAPSLDRYPGDGGLAPRWIPPPFWARQARLRDWEVSG